MKPILVSVSVAAANSHIPLRTLYNWIKSGALTAYKTGREIQVDWREVDRILNGDLDKAC